MAETEGPARIIACPPAPETSRRWWTMSCPECGVEESLADSPQDPKLTARTAAHNAWHRARATATDDTLVPIDASQLEEIRSQYPNRPLAEVVREAIDQLLWGL